MIQTDRLIIRPVKFIDDNFIVELLNEKDFIENVGDKNVSNTNDARRYIENGPLACQQQHGFSLMIVTLQCGEPIGLCGLLKRDELPYPDLGYAFLSRHYRQGYGFEAATAVLNHFHHIRPILAMTSKDNHPSQQLLIKLGFEEHEVPESQTQNNTTSFIFNGI